MKLLKKALCAFLAVIMVLTAAPIGEFAGLDVANLFETEAGAASNSSDSDGTYWAMSHDEAINFIGFMYDKSKITEEMMNAGGVYTFLTGGFEKGSIEEYCAKLAFLTTAKSNLSNCLSSYNQMANDAYQYLRDYFEDQLSIGSIAESTAWDIADEIVDNCDEIIDAYTEGTASIGAECLSLKNTYSNASNAIDVIEALIVGIGGLNYVWSNSKKDMYTYVSSYISNRSLKNSCSEAFDLINDYNKFALTDGFDYDFILDWASDDHIATLESFGDYIYYVSKSFNYKGSVFDPIDDLSEYKVIDVQCPTNVYIYNKNKELLLSIIDNTIVNNSTNISASVYDNKKRIALPLVCEYDVVIEGTDEGTMDYFIYEVFNDSIMRTIEHNSVPLTKGCEYTTSIPEKIYNDITAYNLINETGEEIKADYDSLPPVEDNIVDVIVAEELFDGFPIEIIDLVADTMFNMKSVVDLSAYDISTDDAVALFSAVAKYYPVEYSLITNGDFTYKIIVSPNLDRIMKIRFYYGDDANLSTYQKRVNDLKSEINSLVDKVERMDDFEKALYIHDYIVLNSEYDLELLEYMKQNGGILVGSDYYNEKYSEYSILVNGTGVCGSYALAYRAVLNAAGMECLYLSSSQMNHAWNLVKIDGNWYHVDCCWDDPVPDTYGRARRTYFLRTDSEIMKLNHYAWSPGQYKATSEKYSDMPRGYDLNQKYDNGKWYYISSTTLYSSDEYGKNETEITSMSASSIDIDDNSVYFSTGRYIYEYDLETSEKNLVYLLSNKDSGERIADAYLSNIYIDDENAEFYKSIYKDDKRITVFDTDILQREKFDAITGIEISQTEASLDVFETLQLSANIITTGSSDDLEVEWISSDESIAKVDSAGNVTAANVGVTTITARIFDFESSCRLTVIGNGLTGMCGEKAVWTVDVNNYSLKLCGVGDVTERPWSKLRNIINCVEIAEGINITFGSNYGIFGNCINIKQFVVDEKNSYFSTDENGVLFNKEKTELLRYPPKNNNELYEIPNSVNSIGNGSFYHCDNLKNILIPNSVKNIGEIVFDNCSSLEKIVIPNSVEKILSGFEGCLNLKTVKYDNKIKSLSGNMFSECQNLEKVEIADNNPYIYVDEYGVFYNEEKTQMLYYPSYVSNKYYSIPEGVTSIKFGTATSNVKNNNLMFLIMPETLKKADGILFTAFDKLKKVLIKSKDCSLNTPLGWSVFGETPTIYGYSGSTAEKYANREDAVVSGNEFIAIDAEPHIHDYFLMGYEESIDTSDGYEYYECYCGEDSYSVTLHNYGESVYSKPNCAIVGTKKEVCINCGEENIIETYPATGEHNYQLVYTTPGDCVTAPVMNYKCADCDATTTKTGKIDDGHKYVEIVVAPTCTEKGYTTATCEVCQETVIYDFKSPTGHDLTIKKSDSYCSAHDAIEYSCKKCDYSEVVAADKENLVTETVIVAPTCTKSGTKSEICTLCGATVSTEIISPLSHEYSEDFTIDLEATCTTAGRKSQHCVRCDVKRAVTTIDALGHSEEILPAVAATCTATGLTEGKKCSVCGEVTSEQEIIPVVAHKDGDSDGYCDECGEDLTVNCSHFCHSDGFIGFFWKIINFLQKLFGVQSSRYCECGVDHWSK